MGDLGDRNRDFSTSSAERRVCRHAAVEAPLDREIGAPYRSAN
jgi:hypothetical protein